MSAPRRTDDPHMRMNLDDLYQKINQLEKNVNSFSAGPASQAQGNPGDIRVFVGGDKRPYLSIRTPWGWAQSGSGIFSLEKDQGKEINYTPEAVQNSAGFTIMGGESRFKLVMDQDLTASSIVTDHGALTGLSDDDHSAIYPGISQSETITGDWTFAGTTYKGITLGVTDTTSVLRLYTNGAGTIQSISTNTSNPPSETFYLPNKSGSGGTFAMTGDTIPAASISAGAFGTGSYQFTNTGASLWVELTSGTGTSYYYSGLAYSHGSSYRWATYKEADAAGDWALGYYNDSGTYQGDAIRFDRDNGRVIKFANIATEGLGLPAIVDQVDLTDQSTSITATALTGTATAGTYRVSVYLSQWRYDINVGTVYCTIAWREPKYSATYTERSESTTTIDFDATKVTHKIFYLKHEGSTSMTYAATASGIVGDDRYQLSITVERLN